MIPFVVLMSSTAFATPNKISYTPLKKNPVELLQVDKNFEIPESIYIYSFNAKQTNPKALKEIVDKINSTKKISESELPEHSVFYKGTFNVAERRRIAMSRCIDGEGHILIDKNVKDSEAESFVNQKISKSRTCNSVAFLSKADKVDDTYEILDILFLGRFAQFPKNDNDHDFANNISSSKIAGVQKITTDAKSDFLAADFVTGIETSYIVIRKFNVQDLKAMSPEEYSEKDANNPDNKRMGIKKNENDKK